MSIQLLLTFSLYFFMLSLPEKSNDQSASWRYSLRDREPVKTKEVADMSTHAIATFQIKSWDEKPYNEIEGLPKLTRASVTKSCKGDIEGEGMLEYLMMYRADGSASFVGLERIVGRLGGRSGSFVLQHSGVFEGGVAKATYFVVPGSGTGDLHGLRGEGSFASGHAQEYPMTLDYDFE
jgi:hypothetical protein